MIRITNQNLNYYKTCPTNTYFTQNKLTNGQGQDVFVQSRPTATPTVTNTNILDNVFSDYVIKNYLNENIIKTAIQTNPKIIEILSKKGLTPQMYLENITADKTSHFKNTYYTGLKIVNGLNLTSNEKINLKYALLLHDIGKSLIPTQILEKKEALTKEEKEFVDLHSDLGAEIIKTLDLPYFVDKNEISKIIKNHHNNDLNSQDILTQIVSTADIYSALSEKRSYKQPLTTEEVYTIMNDMTNSGKLNKIFVEKLFTN